MRRFRDAIKILFTGRLPVERRLEALERDLRALMLELASMIELHNAAQARHAKALLRRAKSEMAEERIGGTPMETAKNKMPSEPTHLPKRNKSSLYKRLEQAS